MSTYFKTSKPSSRKRGRPSLSSRNSEVFSTSSFILQKEIHKLKLKTTRKILCFTCGSAPNYTPGELESRMQKLQKLCLSHLRDTYGIHLIRCKGVELIEEFLERAEHQDITPHHVVALIWCAISCFHHFYIRLSKRNGLTPWMRRKQAQKATTIFENLLSFLKDYEDTVIESMILFFTEGQMWYDEFVSSEILKRALLNEGQFQKALDFILDAVIEQLPININYAEQILTVTGLTLKKNTVLELDGEKTVKRILQMYFKSIDPDNSEYYSYLPLRECLECFCKIIIERTNYFEKFKVLKELLSWLLMRNLQNELSLEFGSLIEHVASQLRIDFYYELLVEDVFLLVLKLISSDARCYSILGNRIFQCLLDRNNNKLNFDTPKDIKYNIEVKTSKPCDVTFVKNFRELIHETFMVSMKNHDSYRLNLESSCRSLSILVAEVPSGCTAATVVCLAMSIQEYALTNTDSDRNCTNKIHAMVISILSLICWVNKADVFYDYVYLIMERRARKAPHLNPPLRLSYDYAQHHVLWLNPELFFESWEVRYGLWKRFKTEIKRNTLVKYLHGGSSTSYVQ